MKKCITCLKNLSIKAFSKTSQNIDGHKGQCKKCELNYHKKRIENLKARGLCVWCIRSAPFENHTLCKECKEKQSSIWKKGFKLIREKILNHYGAYCHCEGCSEDREEFMTIEHKDGDGAEHRKAIGSGSNTYRWIIKNNFPPNLTILCYNCNCAKGFRGYCPHENEK